MQIYGTDPLSATYAVELTGLDEIMSGLPTNTANQISARNVRDSFFTVWLNGGGGGGGSFSYTQTAPLTQKSIYGVGGLPSGRTFSNVPLQALLDEIFFPAEGTAFSISVSPPQLEEGYGVGSKPPFAPTVTVNASITKKTPTITSANISGGPGNTFPQSQFPGLIPGTNTSLLTTLVYNQSLSPNPPFTGKNVIQDQSTTFTIFVNDGTTRSAAASVSWFFPRWYGSINLNGLIGTNVRTSDLTQSEKDLIISRLKTDPTTSVQDWSPVWNATRPTLCSFTPYNSSTNQLSGSVTVTPVEVTQGSHLLLIFHKSDYGGDGAPSSYQFGPISGNPFVDLGEHTVVNRYGRTKQCKIFISVTEVNSATVTFTINP
jgi:hypothetical protein